MTATGDRGPLWEIFLEELQDYADALGRDALAMERGDADSSRSELLDSLFRTAHSLKSGAAALGVEVVAASCHALEGILAGTSRSDSSTDETLIRLLLETSDAMADSVAKVRAGDDLVWASMAVLLPQLHDAMPEASGDIPDMSVESQEINTGEFRERRDRTEPDVDGDAPMTPTNGERPAGTTERGSYRVSSRSKSQARAVHSVRVSTRRIDGLLARGEAVLGAAERLKRHGEELQAVVDALQKFHGQIDSSETDSGSERQLLRLQIRLDKVGQLLDADQGALADVSALHAALVRLRMVPFERAVNRVERAVRDLATASGRQIELVIEGAEVEIERALLERLVDPLLQLVRNAIGHGIESPEARYAAGKPDWGTVIVRAIPQSEGVNIEVEDDGTGGDLDALRQLASERGLTADEAEDVARLVFEAGLSTAEQVTPISGRGIGLDVVRSRVRELGGTVDVTTTRGVGTLFRIHLPKMSVQAPDLDGIEDSS